MVNPEAVPTYGSGNGSLFASVVEGTLAKWQRMAKQQLVEGIDYTLTPEGLFVLTAKFLRERGYCCGNICRNCPYSATEREAARLSKRRSQLLG